MVSNQTETETIEHVSARSLIAVIGFSFFIAWIFLSSFWLLQTGATPTWDGVGPFESFWIFAGFPIGYLILSVLGKKPSFNPFEIQWQIATLVCALVIPVVELIYLLVGFTSPILNCIAFLLGGLAAAFIHTCWLDVFSRNDIGKLAMYFGTSLLIGVILFFLITSMLHVLQSLAAMASAIITVSLTLYSTKVAPHNANRAPLQSVEYSWKYTREIEPSLVIFGIIFALTFFYLCRTDSLRLLIGLGGIVVGGILVSILAYFNIRANITIAQRITTVIAVLACIAMPLSNDVIRLILSFIITATCAYLIITNTVFLVRKARINMNTPVFRAIPKRLVVVFLGFAIGWIIAACVMAIPNVPHDALGYVRLGTAVVLVAIIMFFFPVEEHHVDDIEPEKKSALVLNQPVGQQEQKVTSSPDGSVTYVAPPVSPPGVSLTETEVFEARCAAIVKLYQLSPREADILPYLAKGRNNAYLQEKFVISPHTAKSHIYNIYRKLDIHSQQKLMDFVEEFPLDDMGL